MDVTETYIKMCKQAIEIQAIANYERAGDWFQSFYCDPIVNYEDFEQAWVCSEGDTWLPRQDQLQEMVGGYKSGFIDWFYWRNAVYPNMQDPFTKEWRFTSFEQLWLAFVMKEKYGKIWDGESWVKEKVEVANA